MSDTKSFPAQASHWEDVEPILRLFYPQFFIEGDPDYVPPDIMQQLAYIAEEARPWCLSESMQNMAQAHFIAYLVTLRQETSSGEVTQPVAGPITMEKEGDIQVSYATSQSGTTTMQSKRPPSNAWDIWNALYMRCARGAILTRFGDPCRSAIALTDYVQPLAFNAWYRIW